MPEEVTAVGTSFFPDMCSGRKYNPGFSCIFFRCFDVFSCRFKSSVHLNKFLSTYIKDLENSLLHDFFSEHLIIPKLTFLSGGIRVF